MASAAVAVSTVLPDPLNHDVPIVDAAGRPTPQFIQQWLKLRNVSLNVDVLATAVADIDTSIGASGDFYTKAESDARFEPAYKLPAFLRAGTEVDIGLQLFPAFYRDGAFTGIELASADRNKLPVLKRDGTSSDIDLVL